MDLQERISYLETNRDWQGLIEELEKGIAGSGQNAAKAAYHLRLGRVLETKFLAGVKALKHFQDAFKLNPKLLESLEAARMIYWDLGKLNMVQKLCELELKNSQQGDHASDLLCELGDVFCDLGDHDKATATYARALAASGGKNKEASACLEDVQAESGSWQAQVAQLLRLATDASDAQAKGRLFLRAARITRRFAPDEAEGMLAKAYAADAFSKQTAALYEGSLSEQGKLEQLEAAQIEILTSIADRHERAKLAMTFGTRWVSRHQSLDVGARFLEDAIKLDASNEGAFHFLRDAYGKKGGDWNRVITIAEDAVVDAGENGNATFLLVQAGTIAWREMGNLIRARTSFERLVDVAPEHPQLRAFEAQIGETLTSHKAGGAPSGNAGVEVILESLAPPPMIAKGNSTPPAAMPDVARHSDRPT
ncbi:MAG: tetratricopeptide repeat protein, partial [Polyangiaceae bacterium]